MVNSVLLDTIFNSNLDDVKIITESNIIEASGI